MTSTSFRVFKTAWFAKAARKAQISDGLLCKAVEQVRNGQADDLGGGVFKKRLANNQYRSIILAQAGRYWVYQFLFAKKDRANIDEAELHAFRILATHYAKLSDKQVQALLLNRDFVEICHDC